MSSLDSLSVWQGCHGLHKHLWGAMTLRRAVVVVLTCLQVLTRITLLVL